jgi:hypothetical protein
MPRYTTQPLTKLTEVSRENTTAADNQQERPNWKRFGILRDYTPVSGESRRRYSPLAPRTGDIAGTIGAASAFEDLAGLLHQHVAARPSGSGNGGSQRWEFLQINIGGEGWRLIQLEGNRGRAWHWREEVVLEP